MSRCDRTFETFQSFGFFADAIMTYRQNLETSPACSIFTHGLVVRSLETAHKPIDSPISLSSKPENEQLEGNLARQLVRHQEHGQQRSTASSSGDLEKASTFQEQLYVRGFLPSCFSFLSFHTSI
jgi:hypothetical protein